MILDLNFDFKNLDGVAVQGESGGKLLASLFAQANKGDSLKLFSWAQKLHAGETIDIDLSDQQTIKSFIENHEQLSVLAKAQLLQKLIEVVK